MCLSVCVQRVVCHTLTCAVSWRSFANEHRSKPAAGFIDGDLLEQFLDLPRDKMEAVAAGVEVGVGQGGAGRGTGVRREGLVRVRRGGRRVELRNERLGSTNCLWSLLIVLLLLFCLHVCGYTLLFT